MSVEIFHTESGSTETWLVANDDGTVTYHQENSGWTMMRRGAEGSDSKMTAIEAKARWTSYAADIDVALATLSAKKPDK
jgi:hypothetical protein